MPMKEVRLRFFWPPRWIMLRYWALVNRWRRHERCPDPMCGAYSGHSPTCELQSDAEARKNLLGSLRETSKLECYWRERSASSAKALALWQAKHAQVCRENNRLRRNATAQSKQHQLLELDHWLDLKLAQVRERLALANEQEKLAEQVNLGSRENGYLETKFKLGELLYPWRRESR